MAAVGSRTRVPPPPSASASEPALARRLTGDACCAGLDERGVERPLYLSALEAPK
jgi:hypothetical protein